MFKLISEIYRCIFEMNADGRKVLLSAAKDILCHDKYRKNDTDMSPQEFYEQAAQATRLCDHNYRRYRNEVPA